MVCCVGDLTARLRIWLSLLLPPSHLAAAKSRMVWCSGTSLPGLDWKLAVKQMNNNTMNSHDSVAVSVDLHPPNLGSAPAGTPMSHWWQQEGHLTKTAPICQ